MASSAHPFAPKPGCPMCSIVTATPHPTPLSSPRSPTFPTGSSSGTTTAAQAQVIWKDDNVTAYVEKKNPVSSKGHVIILLNLHVPSVYALSSTDLPLLVHIQRLAHRLLTQMHPSSMSSSFAPSSSLPPQSPGPNAPANLPLTSNPAFHVGFITPPFRDSKIPVTDHLHVHAYIGTLDRAGWWRAVAYSSVAWYSIEDLIAEIREQTSNNRVRSNDPERKNTRPIDQIPDAGARAGLPDGRELSDRGLATDELETAEEGTSQSQRTSTEDRLGASRRDSHIPLMRRSTPDIVVEHEDDSAGRWRGPSGEGDVGTPDISTVQSPPAVPSTVPLAA